MIFEFDESGYIKDDERDKLDAGAMLKSLQENTERSNEMRKERGWPAFHVLGWEKPPSYSTTTHNLFWAIQGKGDQGSKSINHSVRILGRRGTMNVDLVASPEEYVKTLPVFDSIMEGFAYTQGSRYMDFVRGDKVAEYGLTALVVGGAGAAALKSGLLAKLWKPIALVLAKAWKVIALAFVALASAIKKLFAKLFGKREEAPETPQP